MRNDLLLPVVVCLLSIIAVIVLQPTSLVRFETELSRVSESEALDMILSREASGEYEPNIAVIHARLSHAQGDLQTAQDLLGRLAREVPEDPLIRDQLAQAALLAGTLEEAAVQRQAAFALEPVKDRRDSAALLYRLLRRSEAEIAVLQTLPPHQLTEWEVDRLARLLSAAGRLDELKVLYESLSSGGSATASFARYRLVTLLVDEGAAQQALHSALEWYIRNDFDPALIETVVPAFTGRGAITEARQFAQFCIERAPETAFLLTQLFLQSGHRAIAHELLDTALAQSSQLSATGWNAVIEFAARTGDLQGLHMAVTNFSDEAAVTTLSAALLQFLRYQGSAALIAYRHLATERLADEAPLVGAAFAIEQGRYDAVALRLSEASETSLSAWDQEIWLAIARRLHGTGYDRQLVVAGVASPALAAALQASYRTMSP